MTRAEKRAAAEAKRKDYVAWMIFTLKARFTQTKDWDSSIEWLENRINDKIKEKPQESELIVESVKIFRDRFKNPDAGEHTP